MTGRMLGRVVVLALALLIVALLIQQQRQPQLVHNPLASRLLHPFDQRLRYRIGTVDPRFGVTPDDVEKLAASAASIWQQGLGQPVLVADPAARLTINLIYDERQQRHDQQRQRERELGSQHEQHQQQLQQIASDKADLAQMHARINQQRDLYAANQQRLNQLVSAWNQSSQHNATLLDDIRTQQQQLQQQQWQLQQQINRFNEQVNQLNGRVHQVNDQAAQLNDEVRDYRQQFQPRMFDKGVFDGHQIRIFEFEDADDLRLTIAHELGHALGVGHTDDPAALMYPVMQQQQRQDFRLLPADLRGYQQRGGSRLDAMRLH